MDANWTELDVLIDNLSYHYTRTGGEKPPLVLLHGFSDSGPCCLRVAKALQTEYDVIMPDLRGHGLSPRLRPGESPDHAADTAAFIQALGLRGAILGGHSMGAAASAALEARFPGLVRALILEDPPWWAEPPAVPPLSRWQWLLDARAKGVSLEELIDLGRQTRPTFQEEELEPWARAKLTFDLSHLNQPAKTMDWRAAVAALRVPALLLIAEVEKGAIVTPEVAQEAAALSLHLQVVAVPGAGHNIRRENFPAFMAAVRSFLKNLN